MCWSRGSEIMVNAYEDDCYVELSFIAGADLSAKQYYLVEMSANQTGTVANATTDKIVGVLQNKPTSGQVARVRVHGVTRVVSNGAVAFGEWVGPHTDGTAITVTGDTKRITGICLVGGSGTQYPTILLTCRGFISV
jgi:hypothetical protein